MRQSNHKKSRDMTAFLYERLSHDDNLEGESYSIGNQKKLLTKVAKEKGYTNLVHFLDDGISGVTMDRPGFVEVIQQLEQGRAAAVFVKDLSHLGRNYIEVGRLTEEFFPEHDIRLMAVSDNIDTAEGENELAPIRNLFKNNFGVSKRIQRKTIFRGKPYKFLDSNIDYIAIQLNKEYIAVMPDKLFIFQNKKFRAIGYDELSINVHPITFVESEKVSTDSEILGMV